MALTTVDSKIENGIAEINEQEFIFGALNDAVIIETTAYKWTTIVVKSGTGSVVVEGSFDKTNWSSITAYQNTALSYTTGYTTLNSGGYIAPNLSYDYVRIRANSVSTPLTVAIIQDKNQTGLPEMGLVNSGALQGANGASLAPMIIAGIDTASNLVRTLKTDGSGFLQTQLVNNVFYNDTTTTLGISATFIGTARDVGVTSGNFMGKASFNATVFADQAGTITIQMSNDGLTYRNATVATAVAANTPVILSIPVCTRYYRITYANGGVAQTAFMINSSFTDN